MTTTEIFFLISVLLCPILLPTSLFLLWIF